MTQRRIEGDDGATGSSRDRRERHVVVGVLVALLTACTYWFAIGEDDLGRTTHVPKGDGGYYYVYLPSIWLDGDLDFTNEYRHDYNPYLTGKTSTGKPGNFFGIGPAILTTPVFLVAHGVARLSGARSDGFSRIELTAVAWTSILASIVALFFVYRLAARRLAASYAGLGAAIAVFLGGPVVFYAVREPGYAHPLATLFAAWLVDAWDASYDRPRTALTWVKLGGLFGAATLARPQLITWAVLLGAAALEDVLAARRSGRRAKLRVIGGIALGALAAFACVVPQLIAWKVVYGRWWLVPQGGDFLRWDDPAWSETLFSARNGLLPWAPIYAVGLLGLAVASRKAPRLVTALVLGFLLQAIVNGAAWDWWAGGSYGGRRFDSTFVAFGFGVAVIVARAVQAVRDRRWRFRVPGAAALALVAILGISGALLARTYSPRTVRSVGGREPASVMRERLHWYGEPAALVSEASTLPMRALFAWQHGTSLGGYDTLVGVYWLGDTFPGVNSNKPVTVEARDLGQVNRDKGHGFRPGPVKGTAILERGHALARVSFNRRGPVELLVFASARDATGDVRVSWNGHVVASVPLSAVPAVVDFRVDRFDRGVNDLVFDAPPGTSLSTLLVHGLGAD